MTLSHTQNGEVIQEQKEKVFALQGVISKFVFVVPRV